MHDRNVMTMHVMYHSDDDIHTFDDTAHVVCRQVLPCSSLPLTSHSDGEIDKITSRMAGFTPSLHAS